MRHPSLIHLFQEVMDTTNPIGHIHPPGDGQHSADKASVSLLVDHISLTSAEAARTLCREDEEAYRAACGQKFELRLRPQKRQTIRPIRDEYLNMISHALAVKARVGSYLDTCKGRW